MLYRQRELAVHGFSGFEGRHYSLFESLERDLAQSASLQWLITALAYKLMAAGRLDHGMIPDDPEVESERRQIFFGAAIGLPTFFVKADSPNQLLMELAAMTPGVRPSRRYAGWLRVRHHQFRQALVAYLEREAADLIEQQRAQGLINNLRGWAVKHPEDTSAQRLLHGILGDKQGKKALDIPAEEFNQRAERYYRKDLSARHMSEALDFWREMLAPGPNSQQPEDGELRGELHALLGAEPRARFLARLRRDLEAGILGEAELRKLIHLLILTIHQTANQPQPAESDRNQPQEMLVQCQP
jgi:hypothetical protein